MKTSLDFEVILDSSSGTVGGSGNSYSRDLFSKDDPHKADDNGEFTIPVEGKPKGFIDQVTYVAIRNQPQVGINDKEHRITFKQFLEMGRPYVMKVTKTFEYENSTKDAKVSS